MSDFKTLPKLITVAVALGLAGTATAANDKDNLQIQDSGVKYTKKAESMLKKLSLSEKLDILSGPGMDLTTYQGQDAINLDPEKDVTGVAGYINGVKNKKLDIPAVKLADGPAGLRIQPLRDGDSNTYYATAWPIGSLLASTWDTELVQKVGQAEGNEVKEYGVDFLLAPGMNIQRNPLLGRNFEYYSEDPVLSGKIAAAMVNGLQSNNIGATIKHFVANNAETNRFFNNTVADPRTLREIYLRGFQIAVEEAQPWAIMSSYNLVNGTYANQRKDLMTDILRDEWGFKGLAMSDWFAGNVSGLRSDFTGQVEGGRDVESAAKQVKAGNDLIEPGGVKTDLLNSYNNGTLTLEEIDNSVVAILAQMQKTPSYNNYNYSDAPDLDAHAALARQAAAEGMILLKNTDSALPLASGSKVASFGTTQVNTLKGGTGSGDVNAAYIVDIASALENKFELNQGLTSYYSDYFEANKQSTGALIGAFEFCLEPEVDASLQARVDAAAENDDAAVITIGRQAGEGGDRSAEQGDYRLTNEELAIINAVSTAFHEQGKTVTVVLNVNGLVETTGWSEKVDSIVLAYMGGQETGNAVADILSGAVNPSGKLAQTMPVNYADVPSADTFPGADTDGDGLEDESLYNEGIYVGYRYYSSFDKAPAYPFGYGLSYTNFEYSNPSIVSNTLSKGGASGSITISTTITNTGSVAGKEAAQVYVNAPEVKLKKPTIELKAFNKTDLLNAGQSETLTFKIPAQTLASFDAENNQWIVEPGAYTVYVAPSSDVTGTEAPSVQFTVSSEIVVSQTTPNALALEEGVTKEDLLTIKE
ncbi:glycoside hydrolase family 3 protein [Vibrio natriegens]|uniref:Glycosyl hydrolase n=1 Tax=Vibrio natriegens NBRC 15636 = ATCC 14048 = DSM 759 TaxID=1219067 RepID=A0AAN1CXY6_VIBNA|nr:glycoside hydrolase family 3 protein [Vibrio natriegens]ALR18739.1 glycosyl hydrolase family 3 [Vibrio natriegens NBRC 15636 = ATCC 14048 = DSM 759]ANQ14706.1 glycosyl hydrolase [Vibrio natriegens NBRC 15636 = ATCC 14048 = DSM 759]EPM39749.1 glycosyl hydrolase family 3 [Vibrio natriegens NBRC 15636 = ATCC 14048 = DSM 759]MDX6028326.1 glycoside hydrolase family 3 C-terminal domain-containing protein [Vibrio natriegens NBRC 15636 = ATCC 14048 = DSM 759]UUI13342.1 glycoside hydrolase family 3 